MADEVPATIVECRMLPVGEAVPAEAAKAGAPQLMVVSFNVLSQSLVRRTIFPYASRSTLKWKWRQARHELAFAELARNADVFCLQEVDHYEAFYKGLLDRLGFDSCYVQKPGKQDGSCIAFRRDRIQLVSQHTLCFDDLAEAYPPDSVSYDEFLRHCAGCIAVLELIDSATRLVVSSSHLFWNPRYNFVKLKQTKYLVERVMQIADDANVPSSRVLICGDFNLTPDHVIFDLITERHYIDVPVERFRTPPNHYSRWAASINLLRSETMATMAASGVELTISNESQQRIDAAASELNDDSFQKVSDADNAARDLEARACLDELALLPRLRSTYEHYEQAYDAAYGEGAHSAAYRVETERALWAGHPAYTTYSGSVNLPLDYIFQPILPEGVPPALIATHVMELQTREVLDVDVGLPSEKCPSDHVPIGTLFVVVPADSSPSAGGDLEQNE